MTVADLAARRGVRHQSMAASVEELLANGYVERRPHPVDGRKKLVDVTALGRKVLESESLGREGTLAEAIAGTLEHQEFAELARGLDLIDVLVVSLGETRGGDVVGQVLSGSW
jgi:DNA-binding MarR family transcriptional regulator